MVIKWSSLPPPYSFSLLAFSPGCAAEGSDGASHMPCTLLPFKTSGSNCWISPPYLLLSSMHKALTRSQPAGQGMVHEPKDIPRCMANQDGPRNSVHTESAKSTHWLQLACLPPRSRKWKCGANNSDVGDFVWAAVLRHCEEFSRLSLEHEGPLWCRTN